MRILFFSSKNLRDCKYFKEGNKNLIRTRFGVADTIAFCGKLEDAKRTKYGVMFTLNDGNTFNVTAGTFNKSVLEDSEKVLEEFKKKNKIYLLVYANPFFNDGLYMNANQVNSVIVVDEAFFLRFHELREEAEKYLEKKLSGNIYKKKDNERSIMKDKIENKIEIDLEDKVENNPEDEMDEMEYKVKEDSMETISFSEEELIKFIDKFTREKPCKIDEIKNLLAKEDTILKNIPFEKIEEKIYSLIESGVFYEPIPGYVKIVD